MVRWAENTGTMPITLEAPGPGFHSKEVWPGCRFDANDLHEDRLAALIRAGAVTLCNEVPAPSRDSPHGHHGPPRPPRHTPPARRDRSGGEPG